MRKLLFALTLISMVFTGCDSNSDSNNSGISQNLSPETTSSPDQQTEVASRLVYANQQRFLDNGIVKILEENRGHYRFDVQVSNGDFQIGFYTASGFLYSYWFAQNDTATFTADLYASSVNRYMPGRYQYVDISSIRNSDDTLGLSVFSQAKVGWDFNADGNVDSDEQMEVVDGTIDVNGAGIDSMSITFDVLLSNGERASGNYTGRISIVE